MHSHLPKGELALTVRRYRASPACVAHATRLHPLQSKCARSVVFLGDKLQRLHDLLIFAFADEIFGCFLQANDSHPGNGHGKYQGATCEPYVAPARVRVPIARYASLGFRPGTGEVREESPGEESSDELPDAPPSCHECEKPLILGR